MATGRHMRSSKGRRSRLLRLGLMSLLAGAGIASVGGCTLTAGLTNAFDYTEDIDQAIIGYRNQALAARAWYRVEPAYRNKLNVEAFGAGWRQGFLDVANGGNGCTPAFPPREYWGWKYQSPAGQKVISEWFAGYPLGAKAAEEACLGHFSQIQTSYLCQQEYVQAGLLETTPVAPEPQFIPGTEIPLAPGERLVEPEELPAVDDAAAVEGEAAASVLRTSQASSRSSGRRPVLLD